MTLSDLERFVSAKYPVPEIGSAALEARIAAGDVLLFDVREMAEYEVSHIAGATHVEPGSSGAAFLSANGDKLKGKTAVFYCSVGVRSGVMAERVAAAASGVKVMNLRGGIFRWYKEGRAIVRRGVRGQRAPLRRELGQAAGPSAAMKPLLILAALLLVGGQIGLLCWRRGWRRLSVTRLARSSHSWRSLRFRRRWVCCSRRVWRT